MHLTNISFVLKLFLQKSRIWTFTFVVHRCRREHELVKYVLARRQLILKGSRLGSVCLHCPNFVVVLLFVTFVFLIGIFRVHWWRWWIDTVPSPIHPFSTLLVNKTSILFSDLKPIPNPPLFYVLVFFNCVNFLICFV